MPRAWYKYFGAACLLVTLVASGLAGMWANMLLKQHAPTLGYSLILALPLVAGFGTGIALLYGFDRLLTLIFFRRP